MTRFDTPYNKRETPPHRARGASSEGGAKTGARKWNSWWSRRSPGIATNDNEPACIGIDAGSKTIKLVALDSEGQIVYAVYHRHRSDVLATLADVLHDVIWRHGDCRLPIAMTGSAGIALAEALGVPFVQEVVACACAVRERYPKADCIVELGGEDAKITYLSGNPEQRMNATCAGGTGDFIDGIASMLGIRTREISKIALGSQRTYPIASRCAVFAQTDVRPLINAGASKADIAQSAIEAVVDQTLGGLACGRPIRGTVVFLGGPLEHIPALVLAFRRKLALSAETGIKPPDAHLFTAMGAIGSVPDAPALALSELERRARAAGRLADDADHLPPLFDSPGQAEAFRARHGAEKVARTRMSDVRGPLFLGFDAGSTSVKYALVDEDGALVASDYRNVEGDTFETARKLAEQVATMVESSNRYGQSCRIARATVTGYGEGLLKAGLGFDSGVVETAAHLRAARQFRPDASFVLDIGGQDMKALWVRDGRIVDAVLNEACSSGCGAFVQSSAKSLGLSHDQFTREAFSAARPVDLGAKCTVFMTSRVRHAQKAGSSPGDIAAGIAYSVVNNVMTRIIGKNHALPLGDAVVVQGGTFKSDAVLRAFEKVAGVEAVRPDAAHLMGAYGAALVARDEHAAAGGKGPSSLAGLDELGSLQLRRSSARCAGCGNACLLAIADFGGGRLFVTGNRCERAYEAFGGGTAADRGADASAGTGSAAAAVGDQAADGAADAGKAPNVVALGQRLIARYGDLRGRGPRGRIAVGLLDVLNVYGNIPFWHTLFAALGFSVVVPGKAPTAKLRGQAAETVPSESVCHPAKIAHVRYLDLVERGADVVFAPTFERGTRCPVACGYPRAIDDNVAESRLSMPLLRAIRPESLAHREADVAEILRTVNAWIADAARKTAGGTAADEGAHAGAGPIGGDAHAGAAPIGEDEFAAALEEALRAQSAFQGALEQAAERAFAWAQADPSRRIAILAGRPYHMDPQVLHRIDEELAALGFAVVPQRAIGGRLATAQPRRALWKPAKRLLQLVEYAAAHDQAEIVALRSFGCGFDAVSFDEAHDRAHELGRPFTELKIDDIADTAHIRIRLRTLAYASRAAVPDTDTPHAEAPHPHSAACRVPARRGTGPEASGAPTPDLCSTAKALVERTARAMAEGREPGRLEVPTVCLDCLTDALPFELKHVCGSVPEISASADLAPEAPGEAGSRDGRRKVGIVGNPLLVFDPELNDHVADLVDRLGWQPVYPAPELVAVDDVRYLDQLARFQEQGVERVIYLQSFGCLKGHVQSRGALHELARRFPDLPVTIIDYDSESSALNRENRIRLALADSA